MSKRSVSNVDGIEVYYKNDEFSDFCRNSLQLLRERDKLHYIWVKRHVRAIVEYGKESSFLGHVCGIYLDCRTASERKSVGPSRYAAYLVSFATHVRLLDEWGVEEAISFRSNAYRRIAEIAARRELRCCLEVGCKMESIYHIQRWLRNRGGVGKRRQAL
jgi:hypothetical protein